MATIQIPSGREFQTPAQLLAHHSKYFRAALNSPMKEATTLHFDLVEHSGEDAVETFVTWLYHRSFYGYQWEYIESYLESSGSYNAGVLIEAWRFGDYIQATAFKNDILQVLHKCVATYDIQDHPFYYASSQLKGLDSNSPVYRMLVAEFGQALYALGGSILFESTLKRIGKDECAAVTKYMAMQSAGILVRLIKDNADGRIMLDRLKNNNDDLRKILAGSRGISVADFQEEIES